MSSSTIAGYIRQYSAASICNIVDAASKSMGEKNSIDEATANVLWLVYNILRKIGAEKAAIALAGFVMLRSAELGITVPKKLEPMFEPFGLTPVQLQPPSAVVPEKPTTITAVEPPAEPASAPKPIGRVISMQAPVAPAPAQPIPAVPAQPVAPQPATAPARTAGGYHDRMPANNAIAAAMKKAVGPDKKETLKSFRRLMAVEKGSNGHWQSANEVVATMLAKKWFGQEEWDLLIGRLRSTLFISWQNTAAFVAACPKDLLAAFVLDGEEGSLLSRVAEIKDVKNRNLGHAYRLSFVSECCKALGHENKAARELKGSCGKIIDQMIADKALPSWHCIAKKRAEETAGSKPAAQQEVPTPAPVAEKTTVQPADQPDPAKAESEVTPSAVVPEQAGAVSEDAGDKPVSDEEVTRWLEDQMAAEAAAAAKETNGNNRAGAVPAGVLADSAPAEQPVVLQ